MKINYLNKAMLTHELGVRGVPISDDRTVDQLRAALRPILRLEKLNKSFSYPPYTLSFADEQTHINDIIAKLELSLASLSGPPDVPTFDRIQSRLVHALGRIDRIPQALLTPEEQIAKSQLLLRVLTALDVLSNSSSRSNDNERSRSSSMSSESSTGEAAATAPRAMSTPTGRHNAVSSSGSAVRFNLEKWGVKFTGDASHFSVHSFLERVSELRVARGVSEGELYRCAVDLFAGRALDWFRASRGRFHDWATLSALLVRHFEPPDYRHRLFREILDRTQGPSEGIVDYLTCMSALFRRHGELTPESQLDIIIRNLSPFYTTQLPLVESIDELEKEALKLESRKFRVDTYVPPPRRAPGLVEPDFACVGHGSVRVARPSVSCVERTEAVSPGVAEVRTNPQLCWNCGQSGHFGRDCSGPRRKHCYGCGAPDVTVRTCAKCSGNLRRSHH